MLEYAQKIGDLLTEKDLTLSTAESCIRFRRPKQVRF